MILAWLLLLTGLTISAVAIYYSVVGLAAIFSAAVIPIIVMGTTLEVAKLVCASWLKANWERAPRFMKYYMITAVAVLMLITSMGIFGFLSKAHNDQNLVSGDVQSKIAIYDEKIKTAKDNIEANRKALRQMDEAVDQVMGRSNDEKGADKAVALRRGQAKERSRLQSEIAAEQKTISQLSAERAPIAAEVRKVEAEVGPIKYIAKFIYGEHGADENMLEKAVTWIIILIVIVFDPLAVIMLLAAQMTFGWHRKNWIDSQEESTKPDAWVADVGEKPTKEELTDDFKFLADDKDLYPDGHPTMSKFKDDGEHPKDTYEYEQTHTEVPATEPVTDQGGEQTAQEEQTTVEGTTVEQWNKMIEEAEKAVEAELARGEQLLQEESQAVTSERIKPDLTEVIEPESKSKYQIIPELEEESKKKTYMTKDPQGHIQIKNRS